MVGNAHGQGVLEAVLMLVVVVMVSTLISQSFRNNELMHKMVSAPWVNLSGMLQNGVWADPAKSMNLHPSNHNRHISLEGTRP